MLGITGCDAAPALKVQESIFNQMSHFVEIFIIFPLLFTVSFGGISGFIPCLIACSIMAYESYPLSAKRCFASSPLISAMACVQSATVPDVIIALNGIPCASTARCILVLSPLLCAPCLGLRPLHVDELCSVKHQSSAIHNRVYQ